MTLSVRPLSDRLGAEILGLDAGAPPDAEARAGVLAALHRHGVVALRGQDLSPQQFVAFCRGLGELEPFFIGAYSLPECPEIYVLSNVRRDGTPIGRDGAGTHWHSDHTFHRAPASVTLLYAAAVPRQGGDTLFVDMARAYDELPEPTRARLAGLRAIHHYRKQEYLYTAERDLPPEQRARIAALQAQRRAEEAAAAPSPSAKRSDSLPDQLHPLVRTHPVTGRKALYLNEAMTVGIEGMPEAEAQALLAALCAGATQPDRVFRYRWRQGDLVAWDNAGVMHAATYTDPAEPRTLWRLTLRGTEPV
ncbi:MAG: TauD/TfdA family dioxygenase [Dongiaceae bacterium]